MTLSYNETEELFHYLTDQMWCSSFFFTRMDYILKFLRANQSQKLILSFCMINVLLFLYQLGQLSVLLIQGSIN